MAEFMLQREVGEVECTALITPYSRVLFGTILIMDKLELN